MELLKTAELTSGAIEIFFSRSERHTRVMARLDGLAKLHDGWHFGQGEAIPPQVIKKARSLIMECVKRGLEKYDVFPGKNGQINPG